MASKLLESLGIAHKPDSFTDKEAEDIVRSLRQNGIKDKFIARSFERGLSNDWVLWNQRLQRPIQFVETVDLAAERVRRATWTERYGV